jgi:hypothetical protein
MLSSIELFIRIFQGFRVSSTFFQVLLSVYKAEFSMTEHAPVTKRM